MFLLIKVELSNINMYLIKDNNIRKKCRNNNKQYLKTKSAYKATNTQ